jgi:hypothetical protein
MTTDGPHDPDGSSTADGQPGVEIAERIASGSLPAEEAVDLLCGLAESDPEAVGSALDDLTTFVATESSVEDRQSAITAVADFVTNRPAYASKAISSLGEVLDDPVVGTTALRALALVADEKPGAVDSVLDEVGRRLTDGPIPARQSAVRVLEIRMDDDPTAVSQLSSRLVDAVITTEGMDIDDSTLPDHERNRLQEQVIAEERLRQRTATVLEKLVAADPNAVAPELDRLGRIIDPATSRNPHLREQVVGIVRSVATASPDAAVCTVDSLVAVVKFAHAPASLRALAAGALATLADERFETATEPARTAIPALGNLLTAAEPGVRANAGSLLSYVAQRYPEEVASLTDTLVDRLDDEQVPVRASVVWTLGYVDTEASRDALRETADVDPDPDVRALAAELLSSETIG